MVEEISKQVELIKRGTVEIISEEELVKKLEASIKNKTPLKIKAGFDPTAPDLHLGHLVLLNKLRQFQELGHKVFFLIGDFTGMIGDPSGLSETRKPLTKEEVLKNAATYKKQVFKVLSPSHTEVVFNSQWMEKMTSEEMLRLCSKYTVARMLERDDFKKRFKEGKAIGIHEFIYPLIQGYDSVVLNVDVEIGGTDQKFNLLVGRDLQREYGQVPQVVITLPLLEGLDGVRKMSKSYGNYVALEDPPSEMFGKIMSISDSLMLRYYELLTSEDLNQIKSLHPMEAKKQLATYFVERFHGKEEAVKAREEFERVFSLRHGVPDNIPEYNAREESKRWLPYILTKAGITKSNREAIQLIKEGAVEIDGEKVYNINAEIGRNTICIVKIGKKRFLKIIS